MTKLTFLRRLFAATLCSLPFVATSYANTETQVQTPKAQGIWIDVRSAQEFNEGHLQDALNIPHSEIAEKIAQVSPNKDAPINLYCRSGRRAEEALNVLKNLGYTNVTNHGGYQELLKKGLK